MVVQDFALRESYQGLLAQADKALFTGEPVPDPLEGFV